eukprot:scaffold48_cov311-Pinguiococcus_pyrenoidosus.AAC.115
MWTSAFLNILRPMLASCRSCSQIRLPVLSGAYSMSASHVSSVVRGWMNALIGPKFLSRSANSCSVMVETWRPESVTRSELMVGIAMTDAAIFSVLCDPSLCGVGDPVRPCFPYRFA